MLKNILSKWLGLTVLFILFIYFNYSSKSLIFADKEKIETNGIKLSESVLAVEFVGFSEKRKSRELQGWFEVLDHSKKILGYYNIAQRNRINYTGYAGEVPIFIRLDSNMIIRAVKMFPNNETPRFLFWLEQVNFLNSWNGKSLEEAAESRVDAVAGVTLTSSTVIANFADVLEDTLQNKYIYQYGYKKTTIRILEILLLLFAFASFTLKSFRKYRNWFLISNVIVFGFVAGNFLSLEMLEGYLTGSVTFWGNPILWIILISGILVPLITNKHFYCSYICPFGAAQELVGRIPIRKKKLPRLLKRILAFTRPIIFGVIIIMIILNYLADLSSIEPFATFIYRVASPMTIIIAILSLLLSIFVNKPWCLWFCPTGEFLDLFRSSKNKGIPFKINRFSRDNR